LHLGSDLIFQSLALLILILIISYFKIFSIKKLIVNIFIIKTIYFLIYGVLFLLNIKSFLLLFPLLIYGALIYSFYKSQYKLKFILKLIFIVSFWYSFISYFNLCVSCFPSALHCYAPVPMHAKAENVPYIDLGIIYNYSTYWEASLRGVSILIFMSNYFDFFDSSDIQESLNRLKTILNSLNIQGTEGGGPDPSFPNFNKIMLLLQAEGEDSSTSSAQQATDSFPLPLHQDQNSPQEESAISLAKAAEDKKLILDKIPRGTNFYFLDNSIKFLNGNLLILDNSGNSGSESEGAADGAKSKRGELNSKFIIYDSVKELENKIIENNSKVIPLDKSKYFKEYSYLKKYYHHRFIEGNIFTFISQGILINKPISEITPNIFLAEIYLNLDSLLEELDRLLKAKLWYEAASASSFATAQSQSEEGGQ
jgi:hypothetical protein